NKNTEADKNNGDDMNKEGGNNNECDENKEKRNKKGNKKKKKHGNKKILNNKECKKNKKQSMGFNIQSRCVVCSHGYKNLDIFNTFSDMQIYQEVPTFYIHKGCVGTTSSVCRVCNQEGALLECYYCKGGSKYHLKCSLNELIVSDIPELICKVHRKKIYSDFRQIERKIVPQDSKQAVFDLAKTRKIVKKLGGHAFKSEDEIAIRIYGNIYFSSTHFMKIISKKRISVVEFRDGRYFLNFVENKDIPEKYQISSFDDFFKTENLEFIRNSIARYSGSVAASLRKRFLDEYRFSESDDDCSCTSCDVNEAGEPSCSYFGNVLRNHTLTYLSYLLQKTPYTLGKSKIEGFGLFANKNFVPNEPIIQYHGDVISVDEADERESFYENRIYMFRIDGKIVDATVIGNLAKYINHSCDPNCYSTIVSNYGLNIMICAKRFISKG
ncbi:Histone-lysine N-methyltransferase trr, partial [Dictyocoela roeselum]